MIKLSVLEKKLTFSTCSLLAILSTASYASASANGSYSSNYVGIDAVYSKMKFKEHYGDNIFNKKAIPGVNLFAGHMFNENWGVEAGYGVDKKMKRNNVRVKEGNIVAGGLIDYGIGFEDYNTLLKQHHTYLGMLGKHHLFNNNIFASLMLGISLSHIHATFNIFNEGTPADLDLTRSFAQTKPIPIIRATVEYKVTDKLGLRALATWRNTSKFKIMAEQFGSTSEIRLKNSINVGAGITYYIN